MLDTYFKDHGIIIINTDDELDSIEQLEIRK